MEPRRDLGQVPAAERRVKTQGGSVGRALALRRKTRLWLAGAVRAQRARPLIRPRSARGRRGALPRPRWLGTDGLPASVWARRETWRDPMPRGAPGVIATSRQS